MFHTLVHQRLVTTDASGMLTRNVELPFAPFAGLSLYGISRSEDGIVVAAVGWDVAEKRLLVFLEHDVGKDHDLAWALAFYGEGWTFTPDD